eukprot:491899_1
MHGCTNNGFKSQKYIIKEYIYAIHKFITWLFWCTRSILLFTSLWTIFINSNAILVRDIHYPGQVIKGNGPNGLFSSLSAVLRTRAHHVMQQEFLGQKESLWTDKNGTNSKKKKKMAFIKDLDV